MSSYVSAELRRFVVARAGHVCEYCLIHEDDTFFGCEVDHIISEKHGGQTEPENLALACLFCNRYKGSDLGSVVGPENQLCRFFNPRIDRWNDHFALNDEVIVGLTEIGIVTVRIFEFNDSDRLLERRTLRSIDRYPSAAALKRIER